MGPPSQKVLQWLHNVLTSEYRQIDRTYADIAHALSYNPWISLKTDVYTFEHGNSALLLNLYGALPVPFRGTTYAFPVSIWIPREYPESSPMTFVTPSREMVVRPGQHVSGEGKIYHPYLAGWRQETSNVSELIAILQDTFAREPPLVTRQTQTPRPPSESRPNGGPPPIPPLPPELGKSSSGSEQSLSHTAQGPPPPPKPFETQSQSRTHNGVAVSSLPPIPPRRSSQYGPMPHIRPDSFRGKPQPQERSPRSPGSNTWDPREAAQWHSNDHRTLGNQAQRAPTTSPQTAVAAQRPWVPGPAYNGPIGQPQGGMNYTQRPDTQYPPGSQHIASLPQRPYDQSGPSLQYRQPPQQQAPQPIKAKPPVDLLTSPFEAALPIESTPVAPPPIPLNPQKDNLLSSLSQTLAEQVRSTHTSNMSAIAPLSAQQAALTTTLNNVNKEISQLDELEKLLSSNEAILHQAMRDADKVLEDAKRRQVPNVDEVLFAPTVVARQIYEAVADERAIEDCRALLVKALDKDRIGGGVWAKQTRSLAREEFLKKALIKKISWGMGLVQEDRWN